MIFDVEPRNGKLKTMEETELDDAVEVTKNKARVKKLFDKKMKASEGENEECDEVESEDDEESQKAKSLADFIEVIVKIKK